MLLELPAHSQAKEEAESSFSCFLLCSGEGSQFCGKSQPQTRGESACAGQGARTSLLPEALAEMFAAGVAAPSAGPRGRAGASGTATWEGLGEAACGGVEAQPQI